MRLIDLVGHRFGKLTVLARSERNNKHGQPFWICLCDCGSSKEILGFNLRHGHSTSCGCSRIEVLARGRATQKVGGKNGRAQAAMRATGDTYLPSTDEWYRRCAGRYYEAQTGGIPLGFATVQEFATYCKNIAPTHCPILGIELKRGCEKMIANPSVDRIVPDKGYVPGNIQIISNKANMMKNSASMDELMKFAEWIFDEANRS